jgi:diguanylate cyclase (GGDEF)-like protein
LRLTVIHKLVLSYTVVAATSLTAVVYALASMRAQNQEIARVVQVDFRAFTLTRDLRNNVLAQEALEKQHRIYGDPELLALLGRRQSELEALWRTFRGVARSDAVDRIGPLIDSYLASRTPPAGEKGEPIMAERSAMRDSLVRGLDAARGEHRHGIDDSLGALSDASQNAYRLTLLLVIAGLLLGIPVAFSIAWSIHASVRGLRRATQAIGDGRFGAELPRAGNDELGHLAREFVDMSRKLAELERKQLDANPLTHLPGNRAIDTEMEARLRANETFAHAYIDLDHFKAYNDRYGYSKGNELIAAVGSLIREVVAEHGDGQDLVGHVGGDDYVVLTTTPTAEQIAKELVARFDSQVSSFYNDEDRNNGHVVAVDRFGTIRRIPLVSMSIAVVSTDNFDAPSVLAIAHECARIKEHLKQLPGSNYLVDRRKR